MARESTPAAPANDARCVAVVVHYRDAAATLRCIGSLRCQSPRPTIVLVDNASPDGSGDHLATALAGERGLRLLRSPHNGGFGAGCNLGIDHALREWPDLDHVLLLNPDAELAPNGLAELFATACRHPLCGIVGCRIDDATGRLWFGNGRRPGCTLSGMHVPPPTGAEEHPAGFVSGACMLIAADLLRRGLRFDETYFLYCEDVDLCAEVEARGRELWVTQRTHVRHVGGGSQPGDPVLGELTADRLYWLTRAKVLLAHRRLGRLRRCAFLAIAALVKPLIGLLVTRSTRFLGPYLRGLRDGWRAARSRRIANDLG